MARITKSGVKAGARVVGKAVDNYMKKATGAGASPKAQLAKAAENVKLGTGKKAVPGSKGITRSPENLAKNQAALKKYNEKNTPGPGTQYLLERKNAINKASKKK